MSQFNNKKKVMNIPERWMWVKEGWWAGDNALAHNRNISEYISDRQSIIYGSAKAPRMNQMYQYVKTSLPLTTL
jgi:hypothetical protein